MRTLSRPVFLSVAIGAMVTVGSLLAGQQGSVDENTIVTSTRGDQEEVNTARNYTDDQIRQFMDSFTMCPQCSYDTNPLLKMQYSYAIGWYFGSGGRHPEYVKEPIDKWMNWGMQLGPIFNYYYRCFFGKGICDGARTSGLYMSETYTREGYQPPHDPPSESNQ